MILHVDSISKKFKRKKVLNSVSLSVSENEIVGIIGPNGSGKTTLLNIICGFVKPVAGSIRLGSGGIAMSVSRKGFFGDMSVQKNLEMYARLARTSAEQLEMTFLDFEIDYADKAFGKLSAGMQQKVSLPLPS